MKSELNENYLERIEDLENRLAEAEQLIEAIKAGEVDAFAFRNETQAEIYTLQSGDYAYRVLVENFSEGALNITEDGLIVYSNKYFHELLELSYEKVIGNILFDFIHPDSQTIFRNLFAKALAGQSKGEVNLLAGSRIIPVYVSLTSLYPQLPTVGIIVTDLSEKKKHEKALAEKNKELERSNEELASFSYVASHDLQEPLRKIRMFISFILQQEAGQFSATTKDYFLRITRSAARMQELIEVLINYSLINSGQRKFELTDLRNIIRESEVFLHDLIEESHTVIETGNMPVIKVVPKQLQQLFTNIISNAIKYRKKEKVPVIKITSKLIKIPAPGVELAPGKYWQISIADNGIGFEPVYANRIFELFQRLHNKEYSGTGIGLAICKKIASNHGGTIVAEGIPGTGAVFHIYLPENIS